MPDDHDILELRPAKKNLDPFKPYHYLHEEEVDAIGTIKTVNTLFLTNKECPFKCTMCDLWKHTLDSPTPQGAIPQQINYALDLLPKASVVKLYNNGNFFDTGAIPPADYPAIAKQLQGIERVVVENHPKLCNDRCLEFAELLDGKLEIALGLETIHPEVLPKLNKQITTDNFRKAVSFLISNDIATRAFILLNPPYLTDDKENIEWTVRSIAFAFEAGVQTCSIIPTRAGNGIMDKLKENGKFVPPTLPALESAFEESMKMEKGRVFVDLWDLEHFSTCEVCFTKRKARLEKMNMTQKIQPRVNCPVSCKQNGMI
ncbi:radical SAM protein [Balneolaceae bacterium YR4-1]|uniref:Radical SAM protein n=2 Tax=Halalkalibaculum roseum TaxID=2709311 RepID=A0A6M1SZW5_9BACT|nr:radical SAM protein [Halalkalibaculum roseum]